jgi:hypothetical protein
MSAMAKRHAGRVRLSVQRLTAIGAATAAVLFMIGWAAVSAMGMTANIYLTVLASIEMKTAAALIQGLGLSVAIGGVIGAATAWICNRFGLIVEQESCDD